MNWQAVSAVAACILGAIGIANYVMLLSIRNAFLRAMLELKDWARQEFASAKETDRRFAEIQARKKENSV